MALTRAYAPNTILGSRQDAVCGPKSLVHVAPKGEGGLMTSGDVDERCCTCLGIKLMEFLLCSWALLDHLPCISGFADHVILAVRILDPWKLQACKVQDDACRQTQAASRNLPIKTFPELLESHTVFTCLVSGLLLEFRRFPKKCRQFFQGLLNNLIPSP